MALVEKRLLEVAFIRLVEVAKKLVVVALVPVALMKVRFWRVEEELAKRLDVVRSPVTEAEVTVRRPVALIERAGVVEVAKVVGEEVAK